jgi:hypothetical protein
LVPPIGHHCTVVVTVTAFARAGCSDPRLVFIVSQRDADQGARRLMLGLLVHQLAVLRTDRVPNQQEVREGRGLREQAKKRDEGRERTRPGRAVCPG